VLAAQKAVVFAVDMTFYYTPFFYMRANIMCSLYKKLLAAFVMKK
jgi:hypothetical protein